MFSIYAHNKTFPFLLTLIVVIFIAAELSTFQVFFRCKSYNLKIPSASIISLGF